MCQRAWFEDRAPVCTLLVFIDDATSRLMQLHFAPTESAFAYFEATRSYLEQHGKRSRQFTSKDLELAMVGVCNPPAPIHRAALK